MLKNYPHSEEQVNPNLLWPRKISLVHNNPNSAVFDHPDEIKILSSTLGKVTSEAVKKGGVRTFSRKILTILTSEAFGCQRKEWLPPGGAFRRGVAVRRIPGAAKQKSPFGEITFHRRGKPLGIFGLLLASNPGP